MTLDRRSFLKTITALTAATTFPSSAWAALAPAPGSFEFAFFTDTHIEPELDAPHGCDLAFRKIAARKPDFAIMGGDHVYDALRVDAARANLVFDLYKKTEQSLQMPLYHAIGNHDLFGVSSTSSVATSDPFYGKKMFEDRIGRTYYSFDHKGYHFIVLDSIQPTDDRAWEARIDEVQMSWLADDLKKAGPQTPVIVTTHVPLVSAFASYASDRVLKGEKYSTLTIANAPNVLAAFENYNVLAVLQGHLHVNEVVQYKNIQFLTGGAVCGNWWHGPRMGFPEGFTVVTLNAGKLATRYELSGFQSLDPREKFQSGRSSVGHPDQPGFLMGAFPRRPAA
jgi:3',5'-cyclic-AMP phosphodiesterase